MYKIIAVPKLSAIKDSFQQCKQGDEFLLSWGRRCKATKWLPVLADKDLPAAPLPQMRAFYWRMIDRKMLSLSNCSRVILRKLVL